VARDKICREIMAVTGCTYQQAMIERDRRWELRQIDAYLVMLRAHPPRNDGDPARCVACMAPLITARCGCAAARKERAASEARR
jgi:hypothetical protein